MQPFFPPALPPDGTVGIVSPARAPELAWLDACSDLLQKNGYKTVIHSQNYKQWGNMAGTDNDRVNALHDMVADPAIDAILCARGGANAIRIVDRLNYDLIRNNPKPFIGFSDISLLLNAITAKTGMITFHAPMAWNFANEHHPRTWLDFVQVLSSPQTTLSFDGVEVVHPGQAMGRLVGGNITRLEKLIATPYDWSARDGILFIEDVDEVLYKIDEMLLHFKLAGRFDGVRAVIVGEMVDIGDGETGFARPGEKPLGRSLRDIFLEHLPRDVPLCLNFPCGHGKYLTTLPLGAMTEASFDKDSVRLAFTAG